MSEPTRKSKKRPTVEVSMGSVRGSMTINCPKCNRLHTVTCSSIEEMLSMTDRANTSVANCPCQALNAAASATPTQDTGEQR